MTQPDFTIEYRWICKTFADWSKEPAKFRGSPPDCTWREDHDEGEPIEKDGIWICPRCGGELTALPHAC